MVNIDKNNINKLLKNFLANYVEALYFVLETPCKQDEELELNKNEGHFVFHNKVYYIDGCSNELISQILNDDLDILCNTGLVRFGFGTHSNNFEIFISKYNVVSIYGDHEKNDEILKMSNINKLDQFITAWETFSQNSPGETIVNIKNGKDVNFLLNKYKQYGIYFGEIVNGS